MDDTEAAGYDTIPYEEYREYLDFIQEPLVFQTLKYYGHCFIVLRAESGKHKVECIDESQLRKHADLNAILFDWDKTLNEARELGVYFDILDPWPSAEFIPVFWRLNAKQQARVKHLHNLSNLRKNYACVMDLKGLMLFALHLGEHFP